ncbi:MAG: hypothetical protein ABIN37_15855, partial [Burkholderiaceae bacterium]
SVAGCIAGLRGVFNTLESSLFHLNFSRALIAGLAGAAVAAFGQVVADPPAITNPAAFVPAVLYRSVFVDTPKGVETEELDWKKANADVGQFKRGHVDVLKWEEEQAKGRVAPTPPATPHQGAKP